MEPRALDEPAIVRALGMTYTNVPVISGALTDAMMDRVLDALRQARDAPTVLHCNSANRTGGPLIALLMIDEKLDVATAVDLALRSGLRSAELMEWGVDYGKRNG
jgi:protein tyrosine phosphatase (PTP) superfamily phosphohydrolase (DUF442 family)